MPQKSVATRKQNQLRVRRPLQGMFEQDQTTLLLDLLQDNQTDSEEIVLRRNNSYSLGPLLRE